MAKTNFSKAEEAVAAAMERMKVAHLLEAADAASGKPSSNTAAKKRLPIVRALQRELKRLHLRDKAIYKKLKVSKKTLEQLLNNVGGLNADEWNQILAFKNQVEALCEHIPVPKDAEIVAAQRKKHINKRLNVSDRWLPLR